MGKAAAAVLYGVRVAAAVSIALAIAFALQLDAPYWAGTTAALICQPVLGSSLRKGLFRSLGTLVGAVVAVALFALFPQDRVGFFLSLAGWCAVCAYVGTNLAFFATYGAMLAGYTAAILAGDLVNSPDQTFEVALARVAAILLGISVATAVLTTTQFGGSRAKLAEGLRALAADAAAWLVMALAPPTDAPAPSGDKAEAREPKEDDRAQALFSRLVALDQVIDQVAGEAAYWRFSLGSVRAGQDGLFACIAEAERLWHDGGSAAAWRALPPTFRADPQAQARECRSAAEALRSAAVLAPPEAAPMLRAAHALLGAAAALDVANWLDDPGRYPTPPSGETCMAPPDPLPGLVNAARGFLCVWATVLVWILTRWPSGPTAITFVTVVILLLGPRQEQAADAATGFALGALLTLGCAAVAKFALLPLVETMLGLSLCLAVFLVPLAALSTVPRLAPYFTPALMIFMPLVSPTNEISYDTAAFYNSGLAIVLGCGIAAIGLRLIPPVPPPIRARRVVAAARAEHAAVVAGAWRPTAGQWTDRMRTRAAALPSGAGADSADQVLGLFSRGADTLRHGSAAVAPDMP